MKITMGQKLWSQSEKDIDELVLNAGAEAFKNADNQLPAYFDDGGYAYDDAKLLVDYWGTAVVLESTFTLSRHLTGSQ